MHIILSMTRRYKMLQLVFNFFRVSAENADRIRVNCSAGQTPVTSFKINAFNNLTKDKKTGSGRPTNKRADKQQRLSNKPTRQGSKGFTFRCLFSSGYIDKKLDVLVCFKANVNQRYVYQLHLYNIFMLALSLSADLRGTPSVHPLWVKIHSN